MKWLIYSIITFLTFISIYLTTSLFLSLLRIMIPLKYNHYFSKILKIENDSSIKIKKYLNEKRAIPLFWFLLTPIQLTRIFQFFFTIINTPLSIFILKYLIKWTDVMDIKWSVKDKHLYTWFDFFFFLLKQTRIAGWNFAYIFLKKQKFRNKNFINFLKSRLFVYITGYGHVTLVIADDLTFIILKIIDKTPRHLWKEQFLLDIRAYFIIKHPFPEINVKYQRIFKKNGITYYNPPKKLMEYKQLSDLTKYVVRGGGYSVGDNIPLLYNHEVNNIAHTAIWNGPTPIILTSKEKDQLALISTWSDNESFLQSFVTVNTISHPNNFKNKGILIPTNVINIANKVGLTDLVITNRINDWVHMNRQLRPSRGSWIQDENGQMYFKQGNIFIHIYDSLKFWIPINSDYIYIQYVIGSIANVHEHMSKEGKEYLELAASILEKNSLHSKYANLLTFEKKFIESYPNKQALFTGKKLEQEIRDNLFRNSEKIINTYENFNKQLLNDFESLESKNIIKSQNVIKNNNKEEDIDL